MSRRNGQSQTNLDTIRNRSIESPSKVYQTNTLTGSKRIKDDTASQISVALD